MLKIAVVEDQTEVRESLCQFIRQYAGEQGLQAEVEPFADGAVIAEGYQPGYDIIFLDVEMPRLGGFGAAERIRAVDPDVVLVFVTNMAQYAIKGYEVDALDYVLKPVSYGAFCTKLSRAIQRVQRRKGGQVALQLSGGGMQLLDTGDILYLETRNRMLSTTPPPRSTRCGGAWPGLKSSWLPTTLPGATSAIWSTCSMSGAWKMILCRWGTPAWRSAVARKPPL